MTVHTGELSVSTRGDTDVVDITAEVRRVVEAAGVSEGQALVSCLFTTTEDLDAEFPAVAARGIGLDSVPLLCCREIPVPGSMERVIRVMMHFYAPVESEPAHVYLGATQKLRSDLHAAQ